MAALGITLYISVILYGNYAIDDKKLVMHEASVLTDHEGNEITKLFEENRQIVSKEEIPEHVKEAFIAVEDQRFYQHQGIDFRAIGRALYRDIMAGSAVEGGSTITQQLAKNTFLDHEKTLMRKTKEVLIAVNLERRYSKDDILEMYLNRIYFGQGAHGIEAASRLYFDKSVGDLNAAEGALLAALPKGPNAYSPIENPERSKNRRDLVLSLMERQGYLTADEAVRLQGTAMPTAMHNITDDPAYLTYVDLVLEEAEERYGLTREEVLQGGYTIEVPMNQELQQISYHKFQDPGSFPEDGTERQVEGAMAILDNRTGGAAAVQGGRDYVRQSFNRVTAKRQPGSAFKPPAVYAPALETGNYHPFSLLSDEEGADFNGYAVRNVSGIYAGEMTMYDAMKDSANVPAVALLEEIGILRSKAYLNEQQLDLEENGLAIALGGLDYGVSALELASLYIPFAAGGDYTEPFFITQITDRSGEEMAGRETVRNKVLSEQSAWSMTRMLEAAVDDGTAQAGYYAGGLAGKTGTTSFEGVSGGVRDLWFAGYTPEYTGAVWMGFDRTDEEHYLSDTSAVPTALFKSVLQEASESGVTDALAFEKPEGVDEVDEPIRFVDIGDLEAELTVSWTGTHIELNWTKSEDERLHYNIYEVDGSTLREIGTVQGENTFTVKRVNPFSNHEFVVVPYSPQTDREGPESNRTQANWRLFSQEAS
ncbi:penicillin-binding protein [Alteribacter lacisalsi]|uniref:Penicillin-binding protein n=1 Tax=Alteribacter lacisalsi TaxID=2045244 RepID=A0A2W0HBF9_9BACI|nr:penicillin-binding protein 1A [Alteribacter lacisalsi]PYZ99223.1 penicillin-binding protein [Alteribacter lacisalsi]